MPKISFVVPTYNRVEWVGECIGSLLQQTEPDVEVIVIDDASTDGTDELLRWFAEKDKRFLWKRNEKNVGAGMSRNAGNALARADIIGVADSDDVYTMTRAAETIKFFEKHPGEAIMFNSPYVRVDFFNAIKEKFRGAPFDHGKFKETGDISYFCHPTAAYRKADIVEIGGYKAETDKETDDYQLVRDWVAAGKTIGFADDEFLCMHRVLKDSIMARQRGWNPAWAQ